MLVAGEAGIGKSRLIAEIARRSEDALVLSGAATHSGTAPYAPAAAALRSHLRRDPDALATCGPLTPHLAMILPELGTPAVSTDPTARTCCMATTSLSSR